MVKTAKSGRYDDIKIGFFDNTDEFVYIEREAFNHSKYNFKKLDEGEIDLLKNIVKNLERNENVIVCARGRSEADKRKHDEFINNSLYDFFVVGDKAQYHIEENLNKEQDHTKKEGNPLDEIKRLLPLVNVEIDKWSSRHEGKIEGRISDELINDLQYEEKDVIEAWKLVLDALLHNHGENDFKPYSFFVSLSHGKRKYETARYYALDRYKKDVGIVCVYILDKNRNNYLRASELTEKLAEYGVKWFDDSDNEIMLINGLFPHNIIGFFEIEKSVVKKSVVKRFVLNCWFYRQMKQNSDYDFSKGVYVNQGENLENFKQSAQNLNIRTCFLRYSRDTNKEYVAEIDGTNKKEVSQFNFKSE